VHDTIHATAICAGDHAVLIIGPSGSGKSDLALRCLALPATQFTPKSFALIADDRVLITVETNGLTASLPSNAPASVKGHIEVRGVGIIQVPDCERGSVVLIVDVSPTVPIERLPTPWPARTLLGKTIPVLCVSPFEASAPLKVALALQAVTARQDQQSTQ
jgi:HPr kinase/phosphorylase